MHVLVEREKVVLLYMLLFVFVCTIFGSLHTANRFYHAMLCICGTSHGPVSLRLSVRHKSVFY